MAVLLVANADHTETSLTIMRRILVAAALSLIVSTASSFAWTEEGHQTVGAVAGSLIKGHTAQQHVQQLLGTESLSKASTWADEVKGYGEQTDEMEQFRNDNPHHGSYHYTDIPFQEKVYSEKSVGATNTDVVHAITACVAILQGKPEQQTLFKNVSPKIALRLLVHYVGDIHQPLHVGAGYLDNTTWVDPNNYNGKHEDDQGGNRLIWHGEKLHLFWDMDAVKIAMTNAHASTIDEYAATLLKKPQPNWRAKGPIQDASVQWATQSLIASKPIHDLKVISHKEVKDRRGEHGEWQVEPKRSDYAQQAARMVDRQILLAGYRLAYVLETIWPDAAAKK